MTKQITEERLALAEKCLDEGWSFNEIWKTHGITAVTLRRYFPGRGWSQKQGAELGYKVMRYITNNE
jgi:hypothetical protein